MPGAVSVQAVSKRFRLLREPPLTVERAVYRFFQRRRIWDELWALEDVTFQVEPGETLAILGGNGSGKSTLLGLLAGILKPTAGSVAVRGRVFAVLDLDSGFHPSLTGRENLELYGSVLGLTRAEVRERFDAIVAFSELSRFIDVQLHDYSSGMRLRLGFALAVHADPEIFLLDEVLAVGDIGFQRKCLDKLHGLRSEGKTIIFASQNLDLVRSLADSALLLEAGRLSMLGNAADVSATYAGRETADIGREPSWADSRTRAIGGT